MRQQGDHSTPRQIPLSCKSTIANNQQVCARKDRAEGKEWLADDCKPTFLSTIRTTVLQSSSEEMAVFYYSSPLSHSLFSFCHPHSLCRLLAEDGDDWTGWIFNRFVLGSTIGGRIVVNIITYRSLPCQTGAITHSSPPHPPTPSPTLHTNTHITFSFQHDSACLHRLTVFVSCEAFNLASCSSSIFRAVIRPFQKIPAALFVLPSSTEGDRAQGPAYQWVAACLKSSTNCWKNGSLNRSSAAHNIPNSPFRTIITITHCVFMAKTAGIR